MDNLDKIVGGSGSDIIVDSETHTPRKSLYQRAKDAVTNYLVDVSAGLIFYSPIMATGEYLIAGMDGEKVLQTRLGASLAQAICMRPSGMLRNWSAEKFGLTKETPWYKKGLSDTLSILSLQIPAYSIALYNAGASIEQWGKAIGVATLVTAITNNGTKLGFGKWMDFWRGIWGKKKAIK